MNPFDRNPFEIIDRVGLRAGSWLISISYRHLDISPIASRYFPRWMFLATGISTVLTSPSTFLSLLPGLSLFSFGVAAKFLAEHADMKSGWNADLFRKYSAKALKERESILLRSFIVVFSVAMLTLTSGSESMAADGTPSWIMPALLLFFALLHWMDAAELPNPDDGDFFAEPKPT